MAYLKKEYFRIQVPSRLTRVTKVTFNGRGQADDSSINAINITVETEIDKLRLFFYCLKLAFIYYRHCWDWYKPWQIYPIIQTIAKEVEREMKKPPTTFPKLHGCE